MLLRGRDRNIVEICDNVNTNVIIYTYHCFGEISVLYANRIVYVFHVFVANLLTEVQRGIFIGQNS